MLTYVLAAVAVIVLLVLALAAAKPDTLRVERAATINADPAKVFAQIDNFHNWAAWSPWEKLDLTMQKTYSGSESGKGAAYAWSGNKKVGEGRMEILESQPPGIVKIKLDFLRPFEGHHITEFTLTAQGGATNVAWVMSGPSPFMSKVMQVFMNMDQMIGKDFEKGLAGLKAITEH